MRIRDAFTENYRVQTDLVRRFVDRRFWSWNRTDGLRAQFAALEWLDAHARDKL